MAPMRPIVISGPSGAGKSTVLKRLFAAHPGIFMYSISHTTRAPRPGEKDGEHYNFTTRAAFEALRAERGFVETAEFSGNLYGTSKAAIAAVAAKGFTCVLDVEMEGVKQLRESALDARFLFLAPPSLAILEARLRERGTDGEDAIAKRMKSARREVEFAEGNLHAGRPVYDKVVVNDVLETAYSEVEAFCLAEA